MDIYELLFVLMFGLSGAGALIGLAVPCRHIPVLLAWTGTLVALTAAAASCGVLWTGIAYHTELWTIAPLGTLTISLDRLAALFLLVTAIVVLATSVFSAAYLKRYVGHYNLKSFNAWYLLLIVSIVLILIADDVLLFLLAWEAMSILSYLLVNFEHRRGASRHAAFLMLAMGEAGFMVVVLVFLLLAARGGSLEFSALAAAGLGLKPATRWLVFLMTFFGFGVKAGLIPVNSWLPRAHPAAPANMSALLSGVILNLGLYGIVRVNLDLVPVDFIGGGVVVMVTGSISALVGILYATAENDLKTMLAHSSIENMGIVAAGLGAGLIFTASGKPALAGIAYVSAFYHMINHSVYKSLLFFGAGTVDDRTGTRDLDKLGGLMRMMPWTAGTFLIGSLAVAALPPFNGFVSEWLTLQTMLRSVELASTPVRIVFALCGVGLALTAALAVTCFVKAFAMGFLGMPRSARAAQAVETKAPALVPMVFLAVFCLLLGILPTYVVPALNHTLQPWTNSVTDVLVPAFFTHSPAHDALPMAFMSEFHDLGAQVGQNLLPGRGLVVLHRGGTENPVVFAMSSAYLLATLMLLLVLTWAVRKYLTRNRSVSRGERWAGGVRELLPEMTYTGTGFSNPVRVIFDAIFRPTTIQDTRETVAEHFRTAIRRERVAVHVMDRLVLQPVKYMVMGVSRVLAVMHHGRINAYTAYVLLALLVALLVGLF